MQPFSLSAIHSAPPTSPSDGRELLGWLPEWGNHQVSGIIYGSKYTIYAAFLCIPEHRKILGET